MIPESVIPKDGRSSMAQTQAGRILLVWPEYPPGIGGMQVHGVEFARYLHAQGIPFTVVAALPRNVAEQAECAAFDSANGFGARRILPRGGALEDTLTLLSREATNGEATNGPVRAVFASQLALAPAFASLRAHGVPIVCRSAGNDVLRPWIGPCDLTYKVVKKLPYREQRARLAQNRDWILKAAQHCDLVLCNSEWTRERLSHLSCRREVVLGGVDIDRFRPLPEDERTALRAAFGWQNAEVLFIAARHTLKKGIDTAMEAVARLAPSRPGLLLVIAGYGTETDNLRALSEELEIASRVRFVGSLPHTLMPRYMAAADVALAPSRDVYDPRRFAIDYETMGRMVCESAACGTPTVATTVGGVPEVVRHNETGVLVPPNDPEALADATVTLLADRDKACAMARRARAWAETHLSFARVSEETLHFLFGGGV